MYINGVSQSVVSVNADAPQPWSSDVSRVQIGAASSNDYPASIAGEQKYDEFAFWKRALSQAEVATLYNSGNGQELDLTYETTETVRNDFTVEKQL